MNKSPFFATLALTVSAVCSAQQSTRSPQPDVVTSPTETLQSEVLISTLPPEDLKKQIAAEDGTIENKTEVGRGGPVAAVVRTKGCMKDMAGRCNVNVTLVIHKPDGSVFDAAKAVDLPATGRIAVPLTFDADAATGLYKVVLTVRDLTARRFSVQERQFAVK